MPSPRLLVVVMGDLARSPRMLRHAEEALRHGMEVDLLGYVERPLPSSTAGASIFPLRSFDGVRARGVFATPTAVLRMTLSTFALVLRLATIRTPDVVLVQVPPLLPALPLLRLFGKVRRVAIITDWHNSTASMVRERYGRGLPLWITAAIERWLASSSILSITVSRAMAFHMRLHAAVVLHDAAPARFRGKPARVGFAFAPGLQREARLGARASVPMIVAPSSWSLDDDFTLLVEALALTDVRLPAECELLLVLTGDGERRVVVERQIDDLRLKRISVVTGWRSEGELIALLGSATAGLSLHRSASAVDLPIKLPEMIACGLPIIVLDYGEVLNEVLDDCATRFRDAEELAMLFLAIAEQRLTLRATDAASSSWEESWARGAWPMIDAAIAWRCRA